VCFETHADTEQTAARIKRLRQALGFSASLSSDEVTL
jgi:hypothetical protein